MTSSPVVISASLCESALREKYEQIQRAAYQRCVNEPGEMSNYLLDRVSEKLYGASSDQFKMQLEDVVCDSLRFSPRDTVSPRERRVHPRSGRVHRPKSAVVLHNQSTRPFQPVSVVGRRVGNSSWSTTADVSGAHWSSCSLPPPVNSPAVSLNTSFVDDSTLGQSAAEEFLSQPDQARIRRVVDIDIPRVETEPPEDDGGDESDGAESEILEYQQTDWESTDGPQIDREVLGLDSVINPDYPSPSLSQVVHAYKQDNTITSREIQPRRAAEPEIVIENLNPNTHVNTRYEVVKRLSTPRIVDLEKDNTRPTSKETLQIPEKPSRLSSAKSQGSRSSSAIGFRPVSALSVASLTFFDDLHFENRPETRHTTEKRQENVGTMEKSVYERARDSNLKSEVEKKPISKITIGGFKSVQKSHAESKATLNQNRPNSVSTKVEPGRRKVTTITFGAPTINGNSSSPFVLKSNPNQAPQVARDRAQSSRQTKDAAINSYRQQMLQSKYLSAPRAVSAPTYKSKLGSLVVDSQSNTSDTRRGNVSSGDTRRGGRNDTGRGNGDAGDTRRCGSGFRGTRWATRVEPITLLPFK